MSQENVEVARLLYPGPLDLVALLEDPRAFEAALVESLVHPDFETVPVPGQVPFSGVGAQDTHQVVRGVDGFVTAFGDWLSAWETWVIAPAGFIDVDANRVLVMLDVQARSKTHQVEMPVEAANLLTLRDGRLARLEAFFSREQALEAAGLKE
jgi:hypothetical protein